MSGEANGETSGRMNGIESVSASAFPTVKRPHGGVPTLLMMQKEWSWQRLGGQLSP